MDSPVDPGSDVDDDVSELKRLADGLLIKRETERSRLAEQLGARIASPVVIAKYMIEDAMQRLDGDGNASSFELLKDAKGGLRRVLDEVQRVSTELRPSMLDDLGLLPTIEWYCRTYEQTHRLLRIDRQLVVEESEVPGELKLLLFRFVEESLSNVAKHANASRIRLVLARDDDGLMLCVEDDGDGFDSAWSDHSKAPRIGLAAVRQRIEASGGTLTLEAIPKKGARITATWPHDHSVVDRRA